MLARFHRCRTKATQLRMRAEYPEAAALPRNHAVFGAARNGGGKRRRRVAGGLAVASLLVLALGTSAASARAPAAGTSQGSIGVGGSLFWTGGVNANSTGANAPYGLDNGKETCVDPAFQKELNPNRCWAYTFDVTEWRETTSLRVAVDLNRRGDCFQVEAWAPGTYENSDARPTSVMVQCPEVLTTAVSPQQWNMEMCVKLGAKPGEACAFDRPARWKGTWTLRVIPFFVSDWGFRLRVGLQDEIAGTGELVPPNLRAYPPYEFGFVAPASPKAGSEIDKRNPPGPPGISCTEDEQAEAAERGETAPQRCLRLSAAMYNAGKGPLDLLLHDRDSTSGGAVTQRVHRDTAGNYLRLGEYAEERAAGEDRAAGEWTYHKAHDHSHYAGFVDFELYRVSNEEGPQLERKSTKRLEPSVSGHKTGWHPGDQRMADWNRIDQPPAFEGFFGCDAVEGKEECITQAQGWGDHYRWQRSGNYVEFPTNTDGTNVSGDYVVRMVVDRDDRVLESRERDNSAYAWIRVRGEKVEICERGYGESPWDPHKRIHTARSWPGTSGTTADSPSEDCD